MTSTIFYNEKSYSCEYVKNVSSEDIKGNLRIYVSRHDRRVFLVNDYNEVERYIVGANQTINFYDSKNGYVFSKSADGMGKYTIRAFKLDEIDIKNIGKDNNQNKENKDYITRSDLNALQSDFEQKLNNLSSQVEKLSKTPYKPNYNNNSKRDSD